MKGINGVLPPVKGLYGLSSRGMRKLLVCFCLQFSLTVSDKCLNEQILCLFVEENSVWTRRSSHFKGLGRFGPLPPVVRIRKVLETRDERY